MIKVSKVIRTQGKMDRLDTPTTMTLLEFHLWLNRTIRETGYVPEEGGGVDGGCALWGPEGQEYICTIVREDL